MEKKEENSCRIHGEKLDFFCRNSECNHGICAKCMITNHKCHEIVTIEQLFAIVKEDNEKIMNTLTEVLSKDKKKMAEVKKFYYKLTQGVNFQKKKIREYLEKKCKEIMKNLDIKFAGGIDDLMKVNNSIENSHREKANKIRKIVGKVRKSKKACEKRNIEKIVLIDEKEYYENIKDFNEEYYDKFMKTIESQYETFIHEINIENIVTEAINGNKPNEEMNKINNANYPPQPSIKKINQPQEPEKMANSNVRKVENKEMVKKPEPKQESAILCGNCNKSEACDVFLNCGHNVCVYCASSYLLKYYEQNEEKIVPCSKCSNKLQKIGIFEKYK